MTREYRPSQVILEIEYKGELWAVEAHSKSNNPNPKGAREENLMFAVMDYNNIYRHPVGLADFNAGIETAQFCLPHLAKHYDLDRKEIGSAWAKEWGLYYALKVIPDPQAKAREARNK